MKIKQNKTASTRLDDLTYSDFVSLINERNRCSGGIRSVQKVIINSKLNVQSRVLEIGCNTGFTSINIGYLIGCAVIGIDINSNSINLAKEYAKKTGLEHKVRFVRADTTKLPFPKNQFDLVWASNVTSFISNKEKAISEYMRVLKISGTLSIIPIYYTKTASMEMIDEVSKAIGCKINIYTKERWKNLFSKAFSIMEGISLEQYYEKDYRYVDVANKIDDYVKMILMKDHIRCMPENQKKMIEHKAKYFYNLFNENLKYCGFSILLYQKRYEKEEEELFVCVER